ncbi:MAG: dihydroneopterin aldolase [Actinomycetes bacterium]
MTDSISITGIRGFGYHGVLPAERANGQEFIVDATLHLALAPAGTSDDLTKSVHYGEVANDVHAEIIGAPVNLIEALAERIASKILTRKLVQSVVVTVHKPTAPIEVPFSDVSVTITRP